MNEEVIFKPVTREHFQNLIKGFLTHEEWKNVGSEIEGRVENFIDELLAVLTEDYHDGAFGAK